MPWLFQNWHDHFGVPSAHLLLTLVTVLCGAIVGAERSKKEKPAGVRTLILVALGSAVFMMLSISIGHGDPGRIAAQVVTGIGFLGAGAILRGNAGVTGMTTAATIWVTAATGMVVGAGYALAGLALSLLILCVLTVISSFEKKYFDSCEMRVVSIVYDAAGGKTAFKIEEVLQDHHITHGFGDLTTGGDGLKHLRLNYCHAHRHHREFLSQLAALPEIREIHLDQPDNPAK